MPKKKFEDALAADAEFGYAHAGLGWNLYYLQDYQGAIGEFDKAIEANPTNIYAYIGKSYALQYASEPDYDQAIEVLNQALDQVPDNVNVLSALGWAVMNKAYWLGAGDEQNELYAEAEEHFHQALAQNSRFTEALNGLGWVLRYQALIQEDQALYQASIDALQQSLDIRPNQRYTQLLVGWNYANMLQYEEAEAAYRKVIELKSDDGEAHYWLGAALEGQGRLDEAREAYQTAADNGYADASQALERLGATP